MSQDTPVQMRDGDRPDPASAPWKVTLESKIIAISGANQGIGLALAEVCLQNGAAHVWSLDIGKPSEAFTDLGTQFPGRLSNLVVDITDADAVSQSLEQVVTTSGRLDGMIANAGITQHKPALDFTKEEMSRLFDINFFGTWNCITAAARIFIRLGIKGSIVMTASMAGHAPNKTVPSAPYGATKASLRSIAKTVAMEWVDHGIRVNTVSPGFVLTQMSEHIKNAPDWGDKMRYWRGMPRLALPQELGGAYVYLLSDTSCYTTGIDIPVAGSIGAW
ncbi:enoyl-(Acyl carrier protein) reductase domain-containing protein [Sarocladium implicatum]|nr:enoyl-(Acyl carrier protein) reductase domain-containing protein [Sarocladium implicatum]